MRAFNVLVAALAVVVVTAAAADDQPLWAAPRAQAGDLRLTVTAENVDHFLIVRGSIHNTRPTPLTVGHGACFDNVVRVRLYRTPERTPPAVWDNTRRFTNGMEVYCPMKLVGDAIEAGGSISPRALQGEISARGLPDGLPDGTYYATASIRLDEPRVTSGELPAGSIVVGGR